jgi:hypoxanthine phosphoribosyltransferase
LQVHDKDFKPYISEVAIQQRIAEMAKTIDSMNFEHPPLMIGVLNGAMFFVADLAKSMKTQVEMAFIRVSSYENTASTGELKEQLWIEQPLEGRHLLLVEDIVDTGLTLKYLIEKLKQAKPARITTLSLLDKPEARKHQVAVDLVGFTIPNEFVIGYGLDYNGLGRNLPDIYKLK